MQEVKEKKNLNVPDHMSIHHTVQSVCVRSGLCGVYSYSPTIRVWSDCMGILLMNTFCFSYCIDFDKTKARIRLY